MASRLEDYALIGDCETAALVSRDGSIDWLCWPRFDSDACFAALLGSPANGRWRIAPEASVARTTRAYTERTLVLETRFETADGVATVLDFMPLRGEASDLVRIVVGEAGRVAMRSELVIRFGLGVSVPWVRQIDERTLSAIAGPDMVVLHAAVPWRGEDMTTVSEFTVRAGERYPFVLTYGPSHRPAPEPIDPERALEDTVGFWRDWLAACAYRGRWNPAVARSLITLKALTYRPTGGIVAAPTTSLPENPGGVRNWDYRHCWLRDSTFTLQALMDCGYIEEAEAWRRWLVRAAAGSPHQLQIMYGIAGERRLQEWEVPWLAGYEGAKPVRIGNAAANQLQLDVFGTLMDTLHLGRVRGLGRNEAGWTLERALLDHLETIWTEPDEGIWEVRTERRPFTHSKAMAWLAFDRGIRSAELFALDAPLDRWKTVRDRIHADVLAKGFDPDLGSFVRFYGSKEVDAALLLLPIVGFLEPSDPRIAGTIAAVEQHLVRDGLVYRYAQTSADSDGLPPGEGAFLACSFWLAHAMALTGRRDEGKALFERLLRFANEVGLFSEEYDPRSGRLVGNFPQAFSHIALINAAKALEPG